MPRGKNNAYGDSTSSWQWPLEPTTKTEEYIGFGESTVPDNFGSNALGNSLLDWEMENPWEDFLIHNWILPVGSQHSAEPLFAWHSLLFAETKEKVYPKSVSVSFCKGNLERPIELSRKSSFAAYSNSQLATSKTLTGVLRSKNTQKIIGAFQLAAGTENIKCEVTYKESSITSQMNKKQTQLSAIETLLFFDKSQGNFAEVTLQPDASKGFKPGSVLSMMFIDESKSLESSLLPFQILITKNPIKLGLPLGKYSYSLLSRNHSACSGKLELSQSYEPSQAFSTIKLGCATNSSLVAPESRIKAKIDRHILPGFVFPKPFLEKSAVREFFELYGWSHVLYDTKRADENTLLEFFLAPLSISRNKYGSFSGFFTDSLKKLFSRPETIEETFVRLPFFYSGGVFFDTVSKFYEKSNYTVVPIVGMSDLNQIGKQNYFFGHTKIRGLSEVKSLYQPDIELNSNSSSNTQNNLSTSSLKTIETIATNGVDILWESPNILEDETPLRMPLQQSFRLQINLPQNNTSEYIAFFVNGKIWKQWTLSAGNQFKSSASEAKIFTIEERIESRTDFEVSVAVWGNKPIDALEGGFPQQIPFAFTKQYCIDANDNGKCEVFK